MGKGDAVNSKLVEAYKSKDKLVSQSANEDTTVTTNKDIPKTRKGIVADNNKNKDDANSTNDKEKSDKDSKLRPIRMANFLDALERMKLNQNLPSVWDYEQSSEAEREKMLSMY